MKRHRLASLLALQGGGRLSRRELWITAAVLFICSAVLLLRPPCLIKTLLHIPCPSCGMTHAWISALQLDFSAAFRYHPMFWSVPILYFYVLRLGRVFRNSLVNRVVLLLILGGFLVNYLFVLADYFRPM